MKKLSSVFKISPLAAFCCLLLIGSAAVVGSLLYMGSVTHQIEVTGINANLFDPGLYTNYADNVSATALVSGFTYNAWISSWVPTVQDKDCIAVTITEKHLADATMISVAIPDLPANVAVSIDAWYCFYATNGATELYRVSTPMIVMDLDTSYAIDAAAITWDSYVPPSGSGGYETCTLMMLEFTFTPGPGADLGTHDLTIQVSLMDAA